MSLSVHIFKEENILCRYEYSPFPFLDYWEAFDISAADNLSVMKHI